MVFKATPDGVEVWPAEQGEAFFLQDSRSTSVFMGQPKIRHRYIY